MKKEKQKIVTIGGGTGSFVVLSGLKNYDVDISAIVSMVDNGGSTGILRDEYGVLPPGDVRQCLVALSESEKFLRDLFNYRFSEGGLSGHSFGNLFLSTIEKMKGDFAEAVKEASKLLNIKGKVIPVTLSDVNLVASLKNGKKIFGQKEIDELFWEDIVDLKLEPEAVLSPSATKAIREADKIVINPGSLRSSIIPSFLVDGLVDEIKNSEAKKICVCSMFAPVTRENENFTIQDYIDELEKYAGKNIFDYVLYNSEQPDEYLSGEYSKEGKKYILKSDAKGFDFELIEDDFMSGDLGVQSKGDKIKRTLVRHCGDKIAKVIIDL